MTKDDLVVLWMLRVSYGIGVVGLLRLVDWWDVLNGTFVLIGLAGLLCVVLAVLWLTLILVEYLIGEDADEVP